MFHKAFMGSLRVPLPPDFQGRMGVGASVFHPRRNSIVTLPNLATRPQALNSWGLRCCKRRQMLRSCQAT
jgi:hypothetical protein